MYGVGIVAKLHTLFRKAALLLKRGLGIVKPHLRSATQDISRNMFGHVSKVILDNLETPENQEVSGLAYIKRKSLKETHAMLTEERTSQALSRKKEGGAPDRSLARTRKRTSQYKLSKRNRKPREKGHIPPQEKAIYF